MSDSAQLRYHYNALYLFFSQLSSSEKHPCLVLFFTSCKAFLLCSQVEILAFIIGVTQNIFFLGWCTSTYINTSLSKKIIQFLSIIHALNLSNRKSLKGLYLLTSNIHFFHSQCKATFTGPQSSLLLHQEKRRLANYTISLFYFILFFFLLSGIKVSIKIYPSRPLPEWTFCLNRNKYSLVLYGD